MSHTEVTATAQQVEPNVESLAGILVALPPSQPKPNYDPDSYQPHRHRQALNSVTFGAEALQLKFFEGIGSHNHHAVLGLMPVEEQRQFMEAEINPLLVQRATEKDFFADEGGKNGLSNKEYKVSGWNHQAASQAEPSGIDWTKAHWGKVPALENLKLLSPLTRFDILSSYDDADNSSALGTNDARQGALTVTSPSTNLPRRLIPHVPAQPYNDGFPISSIGKAIPPADHVRVRMERDLASVDRVRDMVCAEGASTLQHRPINKSPSSSDPSASVGLSATFLSMPQLLALGQSPHTLADLTKDKWLRDACHVAAVSNASYPKGLARAPQGSSSTTQPSSPRRDVVLSPSTRPVVNRWPSRRENAAKAIEEGRRQQLVTAVVARASAGTTSVDIAGDEQTHLPFYPLSSVAKVAYPPLVAPEGTTPSVPQSRVPTMNSGYFTLAHAITTPTSAAFVNARGALTAVESVPVPRSVYQRGFHDSDVAAYDQGIGGGASLWSPSNQQVSRTDKVSLFPSIHDKGGLTWMQRQLQDNQAAMWDSSGGTGDRLALVGDSVEVMESEQAAEEQWANVQARLRDRHLLRRLKHDEAREHELK